jgi:hypothetical protein
VRSALERRGQVAVTRLNPFGSTGRLRWRFDTEHSRLDYAFADVPGGLGGALEGVFMRNFAALQDITGGTPEDAAYMHSEGMAALLAWLRALECPVVGRPSDDAWYRPQRPLPEWVGVLAACDLATPEVIVTNAPGAESLAGAWSGQAIYQPLTSPRRYAIHGQAWTELAKVIEHVPVCLCEPLDGSPGAVTLVGEHVFWTNPPEHDRDRLEQGARDVAARLECDFMQLNYQSTSDGPTFTSVNLQPLIEVHQPSAQDRIADEIARRLLGPDVLQPAHATRGDAEVRS